MRIIMRRITYILIIALAVACIDLVMSDSVRERALLMLRPSAALAFSYGELHLDSHDPRIYNLDEASYFMNRAAAIDPSYPMVHYELARIYFLTAQYERGLTEINADIARDPAHAQPSAYYVRGLIEGYLKRYEESVRDYRAYVSLQPDRWEGRTDLAWALIQAGHENEALPVIDEGLRQFPDNPWLLSVQATALYESGSLDAALVSARRAEGAVSTITPEEWLAAYPGRAPSSAAAGIAVLKRSIHENLEMIEDAVRAHGHQ